MGPLSYLKPVLLPEEEQELVPPVELRSVIVSPVSSGIDFAGKLKTSRIELFSEFSFFWFFSRNKKVLPLLPLSVAIRFFSFFFFR